MDQVWFTAAFWFLLALVAVVIANWLKYRRLSPRS
jgi:hypothetical protein